MATLTARLTPKSVATRAKLVSVAEMLFALRGVEGVSLKDIAQAARQRHSNACQYHFGSKDNLIQAILDKHVPGIVARRNALFDAMEGTRAIRPEQVVEAFVRPVADKLFDADGGKEFLQINAGLVALHALAASEPGNSRYVIPGQPRLMRHLGAIVPRRASDSVIRNRLMMAGIMLFHGLADFSRLLDHSSRPHGRPETEAFVAELEAMILAVLTAPL